MDGWQGLDHTVAVYSAAGVADSTSLEGSGALARHDENSVQQKADC